LKLDDLIVPTAVATPGMSVAALFKACADKQVPGIPFRDASGRIVGKASVRHVLKMHCVPDYLVKNAGVLGDTLTGLTLVEERARDMLAKPVDAFVLPDIAAVGRDAPIAKTLAVMEQHDTTYLFVIDGDHYHGCISIMGIAGAIAALADA
jgi:predicted transcriptional regulator